MHLFHTWKLVYKFRLANGRGTFEHKKCKKCGFEKLSHNMTYSSLLSDAIDLGVEVGIYVGNYHLQTGVNLLNDR